MNTVNLAQPLVLSLLLGISIPCFSGDELRLREKQQEDHGKTPGLTDTVRCTLKHALGCNWEKPHCVDGDSVIADVSGGGPTYYELDLLDRLARLKGHEEKGVVVQIKRIDFMPDLNIVNVQGVSERWMPWTLSYKVSTGKGFITETTPGFTSMYLVTCAIVNTG